MTRWNKEDLTKIVAQSTNVSDVCRALGVTASASNYKTFYKYAVIHGITYYHFDRKLPGRPPTPGSFAKKYDHDDIFKVDSQYPQTALKRHVIKHSLLKYCCEECENDGSWNGKPLVLQLDHKNGINTDNRISNLRFLCPNCHTQTGTYTNKTRNSA